jgi:hypothetical protein
MAQKKTISQAKDFIKSGKSLDKAEQLMMDLLKDSANRKNEKIWLTLFEAQQKQYDEGNEKLYLKQQYDTASLFNLARRMFATLEGLDSLDMQPDEKGRVKPNYRDHSADVLNQYRPNLYNGGVYFIKKQDYVRAYDFFDTYIDCSVNPLFAKYKYASRDKNLPQAAYWAVYCGYKQKNAKATLKHTYLALKDTAHTNYMLQYLAETYKLENDTARYVQTLWDGFDKYPTFSFFFPRLVDNYVQLTQYEEALKICDTALKYDSTSVVFRYAKSSVLLLQGRYSDCLDICKSLIAQNDSLADAYLNAGLSWFNQAVELDKNLQVSQKKRNKILDCYRNAMPYLEKYRALAPEQKNKWALPLYTIYLNLNMGKQFDEIDKLL